ncbi:Uncharacterized protein dnl_63120 [Desulfonema limicola]|uniref:Uncharacterized protein n=1 Tax=Desulfonema limicola TaxID=45656 RepID=A0A975BEK8_9BACT|nr:hypothetical protein [Desulfonema limicola]QTA83888.1 Uncharacterized protein dnl_63120 [Desulfonema limicola]
MTIQTYINHVKTMNINGCKKVIFIAGINSGAMEREDMIDIAKRILIDFEKAGDREAVEEILSF